MIHGKEKLDDNNLQKPNVYNRYLPFYDSIQRQAYEKFDEIRMHLSRIIQLREIRPGFSIWSSKLQQFISLYGYYFTKADHLKLIDFYLSILSIDNLSLTNVQICFNLLQVLLQKSHLITRDELIIDWRLLYQWAKLIRFHHDQDYSLVVMSHGVEQSFLNCIPYCRFYFSITATQEILDEFRPWLCPFDSAFNDAMYFFDLLLPVNLPPNLLNQGFKLWLSEFLGIWESVSNNPDWEVNMIRIFGFVAWYNIGYIDWEPWLSRIFTRFLKSLSLPVGSLSIAAQKKDTYQIPTVGSLIVAMMGNGSSCLQYLRNLFTAIKSFYYPSNTGDFQHGIVQFLAELTQSFIDRVHLESKTDRIWQFKPLQSYRLTEQDITDFVNCVKEHVFISIFNKTHQEDAAKAFRNLAMLRPELVVPTIVEQLFSSVNSINEPHRFTSTLSCLTGITRQIVQQTLNFPQGQTYVLPLLMSVLPGIDSNDFDKTSKTFQFLKAILMLITCVDCSSAINIRNDLTEVEKEVCLSTAQFEDFIIEFLNRIFQMIDSLSTELSDGSVAITVNDDNTEIELTPVITGIVQQCSSKIFQVVQEKIMCFLAASSFTPRVSKLLTDLVQPILEANPIETLKYIMPQTCERIEKIMHDSATTILTDHKGDMELTWCLILFSKLLQARGDTLLVYKSMILSVFHRCIHIIHKKSYEAIANAAKNLLKSLSHVYPIDYRVTMENIDGPFTDFLPIRAWGQHVEFDKLQPQFHIPNAEEVDLACEFVETFIYPELTLLNQRSSDMSNDERLRSLTLVLFIAIGCLRMVPRIDSEEVLDLAPSVAPFDFKYKGQYTVYVKEPKFKENLRMRLIIDIGKLLDHLVERHSDDVSSILTALKIYSLPSSYYGLLASDQHKLCNDFEILKYSFENKLSGKRHHPRFVIIKFLAKQIEVTREHDCSVITVVVSQLFSLTNYQSLTEIDKQVILKLVELSINRYSEIRRDAQVYLFDILKRYLFSYNVVVDHILELLNTQDEVDHDRIKGCLYVLLGNDSVFLPAKHSWSLLEKLWPSIAGTMHATKISTQNLLDQILEKIFKQFDTLAIIEDTNAISIRAAVALWRPLEPKEVKPYDQTREERNQANIQSYNNLMEALNSLYHGDRLQVACHCISAICRLQKPPRIYAEKTLEEILHRSINNECHPGDRDDNLWITINDYKPPKTQTEWEQTCFLDKSFHGYYKWPKIIKYPLNKRERYTRENMPEQVAILYDRFIDKKYVAQFIQFMVLDKETDNSLDVTRYRMFKGLFRNFGSVFVEIFMEQLDALIRVKIKEKQEACQRVAAEIVAGMIRGSKYWTLEMLDELWSKLTPFLNEACKNLSSEEVLGWCEGFWLIMTDVDPRRMYRVVEFMHSLINTSSTTNTFIETSRWHLVQQLVNFEWRIPAVWHTINDHAKDMLAHPYKSVRECIASILGISLSHDITLPNGQVTRHPSVDLFSDGIHERLKRAIEICKTTPLENISGEIMEIDPKACQALNFIETVIELCIEIASRSLQPIKHGIIRLFPDLCNIESIVANDQSIRDRLTLSRMCIAVTYLHVSFIQALIEQIEYVCTNSKWHARCAAIEFAQHMIFCNLFNARPFASRIRELILKYLFDEQFEVRTIASVTLAGFYQCGFIEIVKEDLKYFRLMSKTNYFIKIDGKKVTSTEYIVKRHGGVLGLCAIVLSSPYDISIHVPDALMLLCEHSQDPNLIRKSIKNTLSEFRRTHHDSWHEHREKFTKDELVILADFLISPNYYV
ncbi:unnamed protein product [Rotaria magnacalcarata]|uniref:Proteasome activator complex subunit 4 n=1 Tax=Rotaria magnacalcarata TaxID=392030 RepID=A0A816LTB9_9BILA|nr:unnamed protein product [Rotaria magnacalcarata]